MKRKIRERLHKIGKLKYLPHTMAFLIPFAIVMGICIGIGIYPFGEEDLLHMDGYHQYGPFFMEFARTLKEGGSLLYTWDLGLGSDYISLYAYYLASPLNWLLFLIPQSAVIEFMDYTMILKIALCGYTFFMFLNGHYKLRGKDGYYHLRTALPALACSTAYALSGFVAAYSWDIMWMDSVALAPLVFLGIDKLMKEKKPALYFMSLAVAIFSNYYISIMICIFAVFYFAAMFFELKKGHIQAIGRFALYSLLAGGTSAVLILPEVAILGASGSSSKGFPEKMEWYFGIYETIVRGCMSATPYKGNDHWPNLYAGSFIFLILFLYLLNRRISIGKKISRTLMVIFFWISFANNYLDFLWHGFHFPQALPGRQSFLFAFLLLCMTFEVCRYWKHTRIWQIMLALVGAVGLLALGYSKSNLEITERYAFVATFGFICCYAVIMVMIKVSGVGLRKFLNCFAFTVVIVELAVNMGITGLCSSSRKIYLNKMSQYQILLQQAKEDAMADIEETEDSALFYRVEDTERKTKNDDSLYGYPSTTIFSSLMNIEVSHLYQAVFMEGGLNYYCYNGATPLTSAMLSVKYTLSDCDKEESALRTLIGRYNGQYLYENNYYLPLGFMMTDEQIETFDIGNNRGKIVQLNSFAKAFTEGTMIYTVDQSVGMDALNGSTQIEIKSDGYYYAAHKGCTQNSLTVSNIRSGYSKTYGKTSHKYLLELGECKAGDIISIRNSGNATVEFNVYKLNLDVVDAAYEKMQEQTMVLEEKTDTCIRGHIDVTTAGNLILSIPADEGWTLYVDGKETQIQKFKEAFISVDLTEGYHEIELRYMTPNLKMGAMISIICIGMFILLMVIRAVVSKRRGLCQRDS